MSEVQEVRETPKIPVNKYTLSSGKTVYFREPKIRDTETAMKIAGKGVEDNQGLVMVIFQKELARNLLVAVDGKKLTGIEKENLDKLFTFKEYGQVSAAIKQMVGDEGEAQSLTPEITTL